MEGVAKLLLYDWPGNVRELMHVLERGVILAQDRMVIEASDVRFGRVTGGRLRPIWILKLQRLQKQIPLGIDKAEEQQSKCGLNEQKGAFEHVDGVQPGLGEGRPVGDW